MSKRKKMTTLDALMPATDTGATRRAASKKAAPIVASRKVEEPNTEKSKTDVLKTSLYLPLPVYKKLNALAMDESIGSRKKVHDYYLEAIDLLLKSKGLPSMNELIAKAGE